MRDVPARTVLEAIAWAADLDRTDPVRKRARERDAERHGEDAQALARWLAEKAPRFALEALDLSDVEIPPHPTTDVLVAFDNRVRVAPALRDNAPGVQLVADLLKAVETGWYFLEPVDFYLRHRPAETSAQSVRDQVTNSLLHSIGRNYQGAIIKRVFEDIGRNAEDDGFEPSTSLPPTPDATEIGRELLEAIDAGDELERPRALEPLRAWIDAEFGTGVWDRAEHALPLAAYFGQQADYVRELTRAAVGVAATNAALTRCADPLPVESQLRIDVLSLLDRA